MKTSRARPIKKAIAPGTFGNPDFRSQALFDEKAELSCMAYVDLYPVRAGMKNTPENSDHTSIQLHIHHWRKTAELQHGNNHDTNNENLQPLCLIPLAANPWQPMPPDIPFNLVDYIELIDWTGRAVLDKKEARSRKMPHQSFSG